MVAHAPGATHGRDPRTWLGCRTVPDPRANIHRPSWDVELGDPARLRATRVAAHAGASGLGATLYEVDPGGAVSPYHLHHANEELLVVLSGHPTLRTPQGSRELEAGAVVSFPVGLEGAHRISNASDEPVRVLVCSTMRMPEVAEHLDTGTWLAMTGRGEGKVFPADTEVPVTEAMGRAMRAAREHEDARD